MAFELKNQNLSQENLAKFYNMAKIIRAHRIPVRQLAIMVDMSPPDLYRFFHFPDNQDVENLEQKIVEYLSNQAETLTLIEDSIQKITTETR